MEVSTLAELADGGMFDDADEDESEPLPPPRSAKELLFATT
eukprot:SAG11_NODE_35561_length_266_cov_0.610778_1_plen_40_part_10